MNNVDKLYVRSIQPFNKTEHAALASHLYNWRFASALELVTPTVDEYHRDIIETLARMFGDCGWFDGDMAVVVGAAVRFVTDTSALAVLAVD